MYLEFVKFLTVFVCAFALVELSLGCGQNKTRQKRQDGPDFAGIVAEGAATIIDLAQQGGGFRNNFKVKIGNFHKSINEFVEHK